MKVPSGIKFLHWRHILYLLLSLAGIGILFLYRISTLVPGLSQQELSYRNMLYGFHGIYHNPFFLPINALRSVLFLLDPHKTILILRLPSILTAAVAGICLGLVLYTWVGKRSAVLTSILFFCSAWTLHVARLGTNDAAYLCVIPVLLGLQALYHRRPNAFLVALVFPIAMSLLLFIPGSVWLIIPTLYVCRRYFRHSVSLHNRWWQRICMIIASLIGLPLIVITFIRSPVDIEEWLGLPHKIAPVFQLLKQLGDVFIHIFVHGPQQPTEWLGRSPLLDVFSLVMLVIGLYYYLRHTRSTRSRMVLVYFVLSCLIIALGGPAGLSLITPLLFVIIATGITYLLQQWLTTFPLNPVARNIGIFLIIIAVAASSFYNLRNYFVAWPNAPLPQQVFRLKS